MISFFEVEKTVRCGYRQIRKSPARQETTATTWSRVVFSTSTDGGNTISTENLAHAASNGKMTISLVILSPAFTLKNSSRDRTAPSG